MNEPHQVIIKISPDGEIKSEVKGISGPSCSQASKWVDSLGKVTEDRNTPDYYRQDGQGITTGY